MRKSKKLGHLKMAQKKPVQEFSQLRNKRKRAAVQTLIKGMGVAAIIPVEVVEVSKRSY